MSERRALVPAPAFLRAHRAEAIAALACMLAATGLLFVVPAWAASLVRTAIPAGAGELLVLHLLRGVLLGAALVAAAFARDLLLARLSARYVSDVRDAMTEHLVRRPLESITGRTGDLVARLSADIVALHQALIRGPVVLAPHVVTTLGLLVAMLIVSWRLTLGTVLLVAPMLLAVRFFGRGLHRAAQASQERATSLSAFVQDVLRGIREVKTFGREDLIAHRAASLNADWVRQTLDEERLAILHPAAVTIASIAGLSGLVLLSVWLRRTGLVGADELIWFLVCLGLLVSPLQEAVRSLGPVTRFAALLDRCRAFVDGPIEEDPPSMPALPRVSGAISFAGVFFRYDRSGFELGPLDLAVQPGETVAIVGPSGGGKSTLLDLIPRLIEPSGGAILCDGLPIARYTRASLREQIGVVGQEPVLLPGSLLENIRFGKLDATDAAVMAAGRLAHVEEFAARLPDGYATFLGPRGVQLSVGQRQRVALARALLKDPPILLLDEPTSALDQESEQLLAEALRASRLGRTTLVVTHRELLARMADRVLTLDNGRWAVTERRNAGPDQPRGSGGTMPASSTR